MATKMKGGTIKLALLSLLTLALTTAPTALVAQTSIDPNVLAKAIAGDATSQEGVGIAYATGRGVLRDDTQAAFWYRKAADQGSAYAQLFLGALYDHGQGVPQDYAQAALWFGKAADQGNDEAQLRLGVLYVLGQGVLQDDAQAVHWFRNA